MKFALIEAGGTKVIAAVANASRDIIGRTRIATTTPERTIGAATEWLLKQAHSYTAVGIASFGPLDLNPESASWGHITQTSKPHWSNADIAGPFARSLKCPVAINTDVNGAALAEWKWGAGTGTNSTIYITIGTGVGGGGVLNGQLVHGLSHPEMGHMPVPLHPTDKGFDGVCPFHGACLEGLASGPAIQSRWGVSLSELPEGHEGRNIIAWYLAHAASTLQAIFDPAKIILGGGVMETDGLLDFVRKEAAELSGGYFLGDPKKIIVSPSLGADSGILGALALAQSLAVETTNIDVN
jgi:fructokinase